MAHNMLHDNLSGGPRSSHSSISRRTLSHSVTSHTVNSAIQRPPPVVIQPNRGEIPQSLPMSLPIQRPLYSPQRCYHLQPSYTHVEHTTGGYVSPTVTTHQPYGYSSQIHGATHSPSLNCAPTQHTIQHSVGSAPVVTVGAANCVPFSPLYSNYSCNTTSANLNIPPTDNPAVVQPSVQAASSPTSPIPSSPWLTPRWSPQYQYLGPPCHQRSELDPQTAAQHEEQYPPRPGRGHCIQSSPSHMTTNHEVPQYSPGRAINIVIEDPQSPTVYREKRVRTKEDSERQREDCRRLKERGGACVWCYLNKKKCDTNNPCPPCKANGRTCFRDASQLWLFMPLLDPSTKKNSRIIKEQTFKLAKEAFQRLQSTSSLQPGATQAVVKIRWQDPNPVDLLVAEISTLSLAESDVHDKLKENLIRSSLANIQLPKLQNLGPDALDSHLLQSAIKMLGLLAALVTLSRSRVYFRPSDLGAARITMFYILAMHAKALCETSEYFCTELCDTMRRKAAQEHSFTKSHQDDPARLFNPVWMAVAIYYRVIVGLSQFSPNPFISEIFVGMKSHICELCSKVKNILKNIPPYQGYDKSSSKSFLMESSTCIPEVPVLDCFEIAFWLESEGNFPVSTALARQDAPYSVQTNFWMNCLLDENFEFDTFHQNLSGEVPGPPTVHFRPASQTTELMVPEQGTTRSDTMSLSNQPEEKENTVVTDDHAGRSSLASYAGDTLVESVFSEFTFIEQVYNNSSSTYQNNESAFDPNAFFGNDDSLSSSRERICTEASSESPPLPLAPAPDTNKLRLSSDMADPPLHVALPT